MKYEDFLVKKIKFGEQNLKEGKLFSTDDVVKHCISIIREKIDKNKIRCNVC